MLSQLNEERRKVEAGLESTHKKEVSLLREEIQSLKETLSKKDQTHFREIQDLREELEKAHSIEVKQIQKELTDALSYIDKFAEMSVRFINSLNEIEKKKGILSTSPQIKPSTSERIQSLKSDSQFLNSIQFGFVIESYFLYRIIDGSETKKKFFINVCHHPELVEKAKELSKTPHNIRSNALSSSPDSVIVGALGKTALETGGLTLVCDVIMHSPIYFSLERKLISSLPRSPSSNPEIETYVQAILETVHQQHDLPLPPPSERSFSLLYNRALPASPYPSSSPPPCHQNINYRSSLTRGLTARTSLTTLALPALPSKTPLSHSSPPLTPSLTDSDRLSLSPQEASDQRSSDIRLSDFGTAYPCPTLSDLPRPVSTSSAYSLSDPLERNSGGSGSSTADPATSEDEDIKSALTRALQANLTLEWAKFLLDGENVLAAGLIGKKNPMGFLQTRQLLLTDRPGLFYVDPKTMEFKGEIEWGEPPSPAPSAAQVDASTFDIITPSRTFRLSDKERGVPYWVEAIADAAKRFHKAGRGKLRGKRGEEGERED